jgi:hypothetical protein
MKHVILFFFLFCSALTFKVVARPSNLVKDVDFSTFSLKYKGTLDNRLHISVFLNKVDNKIAGIYYYDNKEYYLTLDGTIGKNGNCIIFENNYKGKITGKFEGVLNNDNFKGTWKNANNTKELSFELVNQAPLHTGDNGEAPLVNSKSSPLYVFLIGGLFAMGVGILVYRKNKTKPASIAEDVKEPVKEIVNATNSIDIDKLSSKIVQDLKDANVLAQKESPVLTPEEINKKKGDDFEKFVIEKFDNKYFKCKNWRGDKFVPSHFPESNKYPDLELEFNHKGYSKKLAVECKFRSSFSGGCVDLGSYDKLQQYKNFERENNIQVYLVLGVGGSPLTPEELYLIPLPHIESNKLYRNKLSKEYIKSLSAKFFYDTSNHCLT